MRTTRKRYERDADISTAIKSGTLQLVGCDVFLDDSEILYKEQEFTQEIVDRDFDVKSGEWYVEDGWVVGKNPEMCPGMLVSKADYFGNIMLELTCTMVPPSTHDINIMISGSWDDENACRDVAYVTGLEAFWHGNIGFEKSPDYKLTAANNFFKFDPTKEYRLQFGRIDNKIFVLVDGVIAHEITDPNPIDGNKYGKIGFEAFSSWWKFKDVVIKKLSYEMKRERYVKEF